MNYLRAVTGNRASAGINIDKTQAENAVRKPAPSQQNLPTERAESVAVNVEEIVKPTSRKEKRKIEDVSGHMGDLSKETKTKR